MAQDIPIEEILSILSEKKEDSISLGEVVEILSRKGSSLILIFLSLPFCQPFQIPGLSTPFGLAIAFLGLRICLGKNIWLPKFLRSKKIAMEKIQKIAKLTLKSINKLKIFIQPRLFWMTQHSVMHLVNGITVTFCGVILALPLPLPLSNIIMAWVIFLIELGTVKQDGLLVLLGYCLVLITIFFILGVIWLI